MDSKDVRMIIDFHIEEYQEILNQYDVGEANETISNCHRFKSLLKDVQKEVELYEELSKFPDPIEIFELIERFGNLKPESLNKVAKLIYAK